jgi:membrane protein implicated in regulation of membrane protease activity
MVSLDESIWLIFVVIGLLLAITELAVGTFDLVIIGSAFVLGGLVTWPFHNWVLTAVVISVICLGYVALGRRYVHRRVSINNTPTNIDAIIGRNGIALSSISRNAGGLVKVNNERWRAKSDDDIGEGDIVVVDGLRGVTLMVRKITEEEKR